MLSQKKAIVQTQSELGSIYIRMDKNEYTPGDQVSGTVLLSLLSNFQSNIVWLTIAGSEQTKLSEYPSGNTGSVKEADDINIILNQKQAVHTFSSAFIPAGQYSFPFTFVLPSGVPSSFDYTFKEKERDCFARVTYEIMASLEMPSAQSTGIATILNLHIFHPVYSSPDTSSQQISRSINSCGIISKGRLNLTSRFERAEYLPGESAIMLTDVDNSKCSAQINSITSVLTQHLTLQAKGITKTVVNTIGKFSEGGVNPGEERVDSNALKMSIPLVQSDKSKGPLQPTCSGRLVNNEYRLVSTIHLNACLCCQSMPTTRISLTMRNPTQAPPLWKEQPQAWTPQIFPPAQLQLVSQASAATSVAGSFDGMEGSPKMPLMAE